MLLMDANRTKYYITRSIEVIDEYTYPLLDRITSVPAHLCITLSKHV